MSKILITGGTGFLGANTARAFVAAGSRRPSISLAMGPWLLGNGQSLQLFGSYCCWQNRKP